ncbi:hypothetical protein KI387_006651, partial [Taxus chinensis]
LDRAYVLPVSIYSRSRIRILRKRFQFSPVERGSPKPDAVGSNPTEREALYSISKAGYRAR